MKIFINYNNINNPIIINNYSSVNSILNQYLENYNIKGSIDDYYLDYNGKYLSNDYSLEKYNIEENEILNLNSKLRGGGSNFFSYAKKNPMGVLIGLTLALFVPLIILPLGFIPLTSNLIKIIIEGGLDGLCKYLVCTLGKVTLAKRIKYFIVFVKYTIFLMMIYVVITFPLILLCITVKGHSIKDDPKSMCKAINAGSISGIVLTMIFLLMYIMLRTGNYIMGYIIKLLSYIPPLNMSINPILITLLNLFNKYKYAPFYVGTLGVLTGYHVGIEVGMEEIPGLIGKIAGLGCPVDLGKKQNGEGPKNKNTENNTLKKIMRYELENIKKNKEKNKKNIEYKELQEFINKTNKEDKKDEENYSKFFKTVNPICIDEGKLKCCNTEKLEQIGDSVNKDCLQNAELSGKIKELGLYPGFILFTQALYEGAIDNMGEKYVLESKSNEDKKIFLRKLLLDNSEKFDIKQKNEIKSYLNGDNSKLIDIQKIINTTIPEAKKSNKDKVIIADLKYKINELDNLMIASGTFPGYKKGVSLFKLIFKHFYLTMFCNISQTADSSTYVISKAGEMAEIIDMLKAGSASGVYVALCYFIVYIVLLVLGIFNVY